MLAGPRVKLSIPQPSLIVLIGPSGAGKSTFAGRHFRPTEVLSSDVFRAWVSDDVNDQSSTADAFETLQLVAARRLARGRLTVVDATNVQPRFRAPFLALARAHHLPAVAVVFDVPEELCQERNRRRPDRQVEPAVLSRQRAQLEQTLPTLEREGFRRTHLLVPEMLDHLEVERAPLPCDRRSEAGPFDIIGDVHGCLAELEALLSRLGYARFEGTAGWRHPGGRRVIFLGDVVDRGPAVPGVLRTAMAMVRSGDALCLPGNHEVKLRRALGGASLRVSHGLQQSLEQLAHETPEFRRAVARFLDELVPHYVLDGGALVVAHAGMKEALQGRDSPVVRAFALYGETTGETDEYGLAIRHNWASEYRGRAAVVYGHTPAPEPEWIHETVCIDTGCVFGGRLTALRWPERELTSVAAQRIYCEPSRPLATPVPEPDGRG
jgi:polynucleotide kinase-phosphatase